jgi:serine protease SohB
MPVAGAGRAAGDLTLPSHLRGLQAQSAHFSSARPSHPEQPVTFLAEYGLFLAKTLTLAIAIIVVIVLIISLAARNKGDGRDRGTINVLNLNDQLDDMKDAIRYEVVDNELLKAEDKAERKREKADRKARGKNPDAEPARKRIYVLDFDGDMQASQVDELRHVITAVLSFARPETDEVMLRLESPGGMVHGYGLAASQLARLRKHHVTLTICVDKVAASGGYMMACIANKLFAAPFSYIGSIGVLVQLPNVHRLLKDKKVDFEMITAGEYKRTLTTFGENTDKDRRKVQEDVDEMHQLFKDFITEHRPALNIAHVATGEVWTGTQALGKGLIDGIETSDEWLLAQSKDADLYAVSWEHKQKLADKLASMFQGALTKAVQQVFDKLLHRTDKFYS